MKVVKCFKQNCWVRVLHHKSILTTQLVRKWKPARQGVLSQPSHYFTPLLTMPLSLSSFAHHCTYLFKILYLSLPFSSRVEKKTRTALKMQHMVRTDRTSHTEWYLPAPCQVEDMCSASGMSQQYDTALNISLQIFLFFKVTSEPVSVHFPSGLITEKTVRHSVLNCSFHLLIRMYATWCLNWHKLRLRKPVPGHVVLQSSVFFFYFQVSTPNREKFH